MGNQKNVACPSISLWALQLWGFLRGFYVKIMCQPGTIPVGKQGASKMEGEKENSKKALEKWFITGPCT